MQRGLVLSLGANYKYHHLKPLFKSLKNSGYAGDMAFFHRGLTDEVITKLSKYGYNLISSDDKYPYVKSQDLAREMVDEPDFVPHPKTLRYFLYHSFLRANKDRYDKVLICDSRDVVFQSPLFDDFHLDGVHCALEDDSETIGDNYFNSLWIKSAFGQAVFNEVQNRSIVCSGTTMGTTDAMLCYLEKMIETIRIVRDEGCKDQGIHNYLIHKNQIPNVVLHKDDTGPFSTISSFKPLGENSNKEQIGTIKKWHTCPDYTPI